jgi:hypothetical protein
MLVSERGTSRQPVTYRAAPGTSAPAGRRESVPGDPAGTGGAVPQAASSTPWRPVSTKRWCEPSAHHEELLAAQVGVPPVAGERDLASVGRVRGPEVVGRPRFEGVRMRSAARFGPAGGREVGTRPSARRPGRGLLPAPTGTFLGSPPGTRPDAAQGRSSGPMQPAAGISALSTETICGSKLRPPGCPPPGSRHR